MNHKSSWEFVFLISDAVVGLRRRDDEWGSGSAVSLPDACGRLPHREGDGGQGTR